MAIVQQYVGYIALAVGLLTIGGIIFAFVKKGIGTTINTMGSVTGMVLGIVLIVYPILLYWLGAALPGLHQKVEGFWFPAEAKDGVIIVGVIGMVIITVNTLVAIFSEKVFQLITNLMINIVFGVGLPVWTAIAYGEKRMMYYQLLSSSIAVVGLLVSAGATVGGAWNKNPTQVTKGAM